MGQTAFYAIRDGAPVDECLTDNPGNGNCTPLYTVKKGDVGGYWINNQKFTDSAGNDWFRVNSSRSQHAWLCYNDFTTDPNAANSNNVKIVTPPNSDPKQNPAGGGGTQTKKKIELQNNSSPATPASKGNTIMKIINQLLMN